MTNVNLWFANNKDGTMITIYEINKSENYTCPVCGSSVIPKAIGEECVVSRHFAHVDKTKCSSESQVHFFFKHKLIEVGDKFKVMADKEYEFVCKSIDVENGHDTEFGKYIPDMTVETECGETIYFEMNYKNKKKIDDYIDKWICLENMVVEVDVKDLLEDRSNGKFIYNSIYNKGKVLEVKGKTKRVSKKMKFINGYRSKGLAIEIETVKKLNWLFNDIVRNKIGEIDDEKLFESFDAVCEVVELRKIGEIISEIKCNDIYDKYVGHFTNVYYNKHIEALKKVFGEDYKKYVKPTISYDSVKKIKIPAIAILDSSDNRFWACEIKDKNNNLLEKYSYEIKIILNKIKEEERIKIENIKTQEFNDIINKNADIVNLKENTKEDYSVSFWISAPHYIKKGIFLLHSNIQYKGTHTLNRTAFEFKEITNVNDYLFTRCNEFMEYMWIDKVAIDKTLYETVISEVETELSKYHNVSGDLFELAENECSIRFKYNKSDTKYFYLKDNHSLSNNRQYKDDCFRFNFKNAKDLSAYIIKDVLLEMEKQDFWCNDCHNKFKLSLGELKFFKSREFDIPKRCPECRRKNKSYKGV